MVLDLVYFDVCCPIKIESLGRFEYFLISIDDDLQSSRKVLKCLWTDNRGEYKFKVLESYCSEHGIRLEKIVPSTPTSQWCEKKMTGTIVDKVRSMLKMAR